MKKRKVLFLSIIIIAVLSLGAYFAWSNNILGIRTKKVESSATSADFEIKMLDVGQGLSVLIKCDGKYMLYDGGGRARSSYVVSFLKGHEVASLDYLIASHYDEDHLSGLIGVLNTTHVNTAITPDYVNDTSTYYSFQNKLAQSEASVVHPDVGDCFALGSAKITIIGPKSYDHEKDNDKSIAIRITYGRFGIILTGDAEYEAEDDMLSSGMKLRSDVYIVGHHGSANSSNEKFLRKVKPSYALISVGAENSYGHPSSETIGRLEKIGAEIFRTDQDGEINVFISGNTIWFKTENG